MPLSGTAGNKSETLRLDAGSVTSSAGYENTNAISFVIQDVPVKPTLTSVTRTLNAATREDFKLEATDTIAFLFSEPMNVAKTQAALQQTFWDNNTTLGGITGCAFNDNATAGDFTAGAIHADNFTASNSNQTFTLTLAAGDNLTATNTNTDCAFTVYQDNSTTPVTATDANGIAMVSQTGAITAANLDPTTIPTLDNVTVTAATNLEDFKLEASDTIVFNFSESMDSTGTTLKDALVHTINTSSKITGCTYANGGTAVTTAHIAVSGSQATVTLPAGSLTADNGTADCVFTVDNNTTTQATDAHGIAMASTAVTVKASDFDPPVKATLTSVAVTYKADGTTEGYDNLTAGDKVAFTFSEAMTPAKVQAALLQTFKNDNSTLGSIAGCTFADAGGDLASGDFSGTTTSYTLTLAANDNLTLDSGKTGCVFSVFKDSASTIVTDASEGLVAIDNTSATLNFVNSPVALTSITAGRGTATTLGNNQLDGAGTSGSATGDNLTFSFTSSTNFTAMGTTIKTDIAAAIDAKVDNSTTCGVAAADVGNVAASNAGSPVVYTAAYTATLPTGCTLATASDVSFNLSGIQDNNEILLSTDNATATLAATDAPSLTVSENDALADGKINEGTVITFTFGSTLSGGVANGVMNDGLTLAAVQEAGNTAAIATGGDKDTFKAAISTTGSVYTLTVNPGKAYTLVGDQTFSFGATEDTFKPTTVDAQVFSALSGKITETLATQTAPTYTTATLTYEANSVSGNRATFAGSNNLTKGIWLLDGTSSTLTAEKDVFFFSGDQ